MGGERARECPQESLSPDGTFPREWQRLLAGELAAGGLLYGDLDQVLENLVGRAREELQGLE